MKITHRLKSLRTLLFVGICIAGLATAYYFFVPRTDGIVSFDSMRDMRNVAALFERNRYWLTSTPNYSIEYAMRNKSPHQDPFYWGKLKTDVLLDAKGAFIGFVSSYMETASIGKLLFLAVDEPSRGKGYSDILLKHGVAQLRARGAREVRLVTRPSNISAQKVYHRVGFHEAGRDETYVYFSYVF